MKKGYSQPDDETALEEKLSQYTESQESDGKQPEEKTINLWPQSYRLTRTFANAYSLYGSRRTDTAPISNLPTPSSSG